MFKVPTVSVVIPAYNAASFLREAIDSVLRQTKPPLEVIVVDDGSIDETAAIANTYSPEVTLIRQANQGVSVARNRGIDQAKGEWIAFLDADDRWVPSKLETLLDALQQAQVDSVCVYSDYTNVYSTSRLVRECPLWPCEGERRVRMLTNPPPINPSAAMVRASVARQVRFPVGIADGEDTIFAMLVSDHGGILHVPHSLVEYRKHPRQQTSRQAFWLHMVAAQCRWISQNPGVLPEKDIELFRAVSGEQLVQRHDNAFWHGDYETVKLARELYVELFPKAHSFPPLFHKKAPTSTMRIAYKIWNRLRGVLPERVQRGVSYACHPIIEHLKRKIV